jgi:large subunit ribosomal protein L21
MFAVFEYNKVQFKASEGAELQMPKIVSDKKSIVFENVLLISDEKKSEIGTPFIKNAKVEAEILREERTEKIRVFKFKAKKRYKRTLGHRDQKTRVLIKKIQFAK